MASTSINLTGNPNIDGILCGVRKSGNLVSRRTMALIFASALACVGAPGQAAEIRVGVRAFAQDSSIDASGSRSDGGIFSAPPIGSATAMFAAGPARADVHGEGNALTGSLRADVKALVSADRYIVGRNAHASSEAAMTGSITLSGAVPAGLATFSAVVEGAYTFNNSPFNYLNGARLSFSAVVGDGARSGALDFDPRTLAGLFSLPLSWTQTVHPGERIDMSFYMRGTVDALVGAVDLDVSNTFKVTAIDLPPGYTYTSDAEGFLSQFQPSAVPEPASAALMALGLSIAFALTRRGAWRQR